MCAGILLLSACASSRRASLPLPPVRELFGNLQTTSLFLAQVGGGNESQDLGVLNGNALVRVNTHTLFTATDGTGVSSGVTDSVLPAMTDAAVLVYEYTGQEQELLRQGKTGADAFTGKWYLSPALLEQRPQLSGLPVLTAFTAGKTYDVRSDLPLVLTATYGASASPAFRAQIAPVYRCGNGRTEGQQFISELGLNHLAEGCDDGNDVDTDTCSNQCQARTPDTGASCGNGVKEGTEQCDHGGDRSRGCAADCRAAVGYICQEDNTCVRLIPDFGSASAPSSVASSVSSSSPVDRQSSSSSTARGVARLVVNQLLLPNDAPLVRGKDDQIVFRFQMASPETLSVGTIFFQQEAETNPEIVDVWPIQSLKLECGTTAFQPLQAKFWSDWATLGISEFRLPDNSLYYLPANTPVTCNVRAKIKDYTQTNSFKLRFAYKENAVGRNYVAANNPTGTMLQNIRTNGVCAAAGCDIAVTLFDPPALRIVGSAVSSAASSVGSNASAAPISGAWSANGNVWAMKKMGNTLYLGGSFTEVGGQPRYGLAAVDATTGEVLPWNPNAHYTGAAGESIVQAMAAEGNTLYVGGNFSYIGSTVRNRVAAIDATSGVVLPWGASLNAKPYDTPSIISSLALAGDTLYGGGNNYRCGLAAWNKATGELVSAWHPCVNHYVTAVVPLAGGNLLVAGAFDMVTNASGTSQPRGNVAIVNGSTGEFLPWAPRVNGTVYAALVNGTNVFLGGSFSQVEGKPRQNFAVLHATTGALSDIKADANAPVWTFLLDGFKLYVGGGFSVIGGQATDTGLAVMDPYVGGVLPWNRLTTQSLPREPKALASDAQYLYAGGGLIDIFGRPFLNPIGKVRK